MRASWTIVIDEKVLMLYHRDTIGPPRSIFRRRLFQSSIHDPRNENPCVKSIYWYDAYLPQTGNKSDAVVVSIKSLKTIQSVLQRYVTEIAFLFAFAFHHL